jgi:hypothetical protein
MMDQNTLIADLPQGCRSEIVWIAYIKRALASRDLPGCERLELLEWLGSCVGGPLTAAAMEAIEPASDGLVEAIAKVTRLNPDSPESAFAMLGQREVFAGLCECHPSLLTAITLCWTRH